jgi:hypothetical protein
MHNFHCMGYNIPFVNWPLGLLSVPRILMRIFILVKRSSANKDILLRFDTQCIWNVTQIRQGRMEYYPVGSQLGAEAMTTKTGCLCASATLKYIKQDLMKCVGTCRKHYPSGTDPPWPAVWSQDPEPRPHAHSLLEVEHLKHTPPVSI